MNTGTTHFTSGTFKDAALGTQQGGGQGECLIIGNWGEAGGREGRELQVRATALWVHRGDPELLWGRGEVVGSAVVAPLCPNTQSSRRRLTHYR